MTEQNSAPTLSADRPADNTLAMLMCARNEARFLAANLLYHYALGVRKCYLFLDRCTDNSREIVANFPWVRCMEVDPDDASRMLHVSDLMVACMDRALQLARQDGFEWLMIVDPDEFACANPSASPTETACEAGNLLRLISQVDPAVEQIQLKTKEVTPQVMEGELPFWKQTFFLKDPQFTRRFFDPESGDVFEWQGVVGHSEGKCIVRTSADAQGYDSHRWVVNQQRVYPTRPAFLPLQTVHRGSHFHFAIVSQEHWLEKYQQLAHESEVWPCGTPVELPKHCWKKATSTLPPEALGGYFREWIGMSAEKLKALAEQRVVEQRNLVEQVLEEIGAIQSGKLRLPERAGESPVIALEPFSFPKDYWRSAPGTVEDNDAVTLAIADLPSWRLVRFYGVECERGTYFRWAQPEVESTVHLPPADYDLVVDSGPLWKLWKGKLQVTVNGQAVRSAGRKLGSKVVTARLPAEDFDPSGEQRIGLRFNQLNTGNSSDPRNLGAPIASLAFLRPSARGFLGRLFSERTPKKAG